LKGEQVNNEYWEICQELGITGSFWDRIMKPGGFRLSLGTFTKRTELIKKYSFAIPSPEALAEIAGYSPLIEIGAGTGYWAALLKAQGADIIATDLFPPAKQKNHWHDQEYIHVACVDAGVAVRTYPDRNVFCCWPYMDNVLHRAAKAMAPGRFLLYIGESEGGCTADDGFFELMGNGSFEAIPAKTRLPQWDGIHDELYVWRRKEIERSER